MELYRDNQNVSMKSMPHVIDNVCDWISNIYFHDCNVIEVVGYYNAFDEVKVEYR